MAHAPPVIQPQLCFSFHSKHIIPEYKYLDFFFENLTFILHQHLKNSNLHSLFAIFYPNSHISINKLRLTPRSSPPALEPLAKSLAYSIPSSVQITSSSVNQIQATTVQAALCANMKHSSIFAAT